MTGEIKMHDMVALMQDVQAKHFVSGEAVLLHRGQIGTVVMIYQDGACEVEFADRDGRAFAILSLRPDHLMVLHDKPDFAAV
jgi:CRP-like cAMP-binding protein